MDFNKRIAGIPTWGWIAGVTGGVFLGLYLRSRKRVATETVGVETPTPVPLGATASYEGMIAEGSGLPGSPGFVGATGNFEGQLSREVESVSKQFHEELESARGILKAEVEATLRQSHEELIAAQQVIHEGAATPAPIQVVVGGSSPAGGMEGGGPPVPTVRTPRPPAAPPAPPSADHIFVDKAQAAHVQMFHSMQSRAILEERHKKHPEWGPYTVANNGKIRGHSTAF